ncbi:transposase [Silvimonas sp. JCM 19000]
MSRYLRLRRGGAVSFFTVNLEDPSLDLLTRHARGLGVAVRTVRDTHPFTVHAWVLMPNHLHCVLELPPADDDFGVRWRLIKSVFSRSLPMDEARSPSRANRGERGIWQRRYWEHRIENPQNLRAHIDYVHINPIKHGYVTRLADWPWSTFHRYVAQGLYPPDWAGPP